VQLLLRLLLPEPLQLWLLLGEETVEVCDCCYECRDQACNNEKGGGVLMITWCGSMQSKKHRLEAAGRIQAVSFVQKALDPFVMLTVIKSQLTDEKQHHAVSLAICAAASAGVCRERNLHGLTR
jgi:hypothetical protein